MEDRCCCWLLAAGAHLSLRPLRPHRSISTCRPLPLFSASSLLCEGPKPFPTLRGELDLTPSPVRPTSSIAFSLLPLFISSTSTTRQHGYFILPLSELPDIRIREQRDQSKHNPNTALSRPLALSAACSLLPSLCPCPECPLPSPTKKHAHYPLNLPRTHAGIFADRCDSCAALAFLTLKLISLSPFLHHLRRQTTTSGSVSTAVRVDSGITRSRFHPKLKSQISTVS